MNSSVDGILMIGFGGPTDTSEVRPFLANVTHGRNIPEARIQEVLHHYKAIGGRSPYNDLTLRQVNAFRELAKLRGLNLPVYLGMRNWSPYLREILIQMKRDGVRRVIGFVLAPQRSYSSFQQYVENVETAKEESGFTELQVAYVEPWHDHPLFIAAITERVKETLSQIGEESPDQTLLIFTAHSIPITMAEQCAYAGEVETSARLVAEQLGRKRWTVAYQSRSGRPQDPWLEPDIIDVFPHVYQHGVRNVVTIPIGFLSDHAEILYDLDHEAKKSAESFGLQFFRTATVMDHPKFIEMIYDVITSKVGMPVP